MNKLVEDFRESLSRGIPNNRIIYLAGFFDGEGNIQFGRNKSVPCGLQVRVGQKPQGIEILNQFKWYFGGSIYEYSSKPFYLWEITSKGAANCLNKLLPYLRLKKRQAELAIEFQKLMKKGGRLTSTEIAERVELEQEFRELR